jgi:hypothetical protein
VRRIAISRLIVALGCIHVAAACAAKSAITSKAIHFPGEISEARSPNGRYALVNIDAETEAQADSIGANHALLLRDVRFNTSQPLYKYNRHIEATWSPDGDGLAITDYRSSDQSTCEIISLSKQLRRVDLWERFMRNPDVDSTLFKEHHVYIEAASWVSDDVVQVNVRGYGQSAPQGSTLRYLYFIAGDSLKVTSP